MSADKVGTAEEREERAADGTLTRRDVSIFPIAAQAGARAPVPGSARAPADEPLSMELTRVVRHLNGLAVAVEALRAKVLERERAAKVGP